MLRKTLCISLLTILTAAALPREVEAQRRAIRRPAGRPAVVVRARPYYPVYYSRFYSPFYAGWYGGWYGGWPGAGWYGWNGWYPHGFYGQYYPPYPYRYANAGSARIEVKPREAEVYVDGYLVGTVDDFDGWLQRLHLPYGEHDIEIYLRGHRTMREQVLLRPGATLKISGALEPLPAGTPDEPRPRPAERTEAREHRDAYPADPRRAYPRDPGPQRVPRQDQAAADFGSLTIRVQPGDAEVFIDGDRWEVPAGGDRLIVQLAGGEHRVEIRRSGYRTYSTTIRVQPGETVPLNVSLTRQEGA